MTAWDCVRAIVILGPISILIVVGLIIAVHSKAGRRGPRSGMDVASRAVIHVGGYVVGLAIIHRLVGQHLPSIW